MTSPLHRLAVAIVCLLCLAPPAGGFAEQRRSVPVFERRSGGLFPNAAAGRRSGEFPTARAIHDFDRPSRAGQRRLRERAERRLLRGEAGYVENWHVAVIRIAFEANRARDLTSIRTDGDFDLAPGGTSIIDPTPHDKAYFNAHMEALARYYDFQSCGAVEITWEILPEGNDESYRLSDVADFGPGRGGMWTTELLVRFVRHAVEACDAALAAQGYQVRLSDYDAIVLAHAGANLQSDVLGNSPNDIPSFYARLGDGEEIAVEGGTHLVTELSVIPETAVQDGYNGGIAAVLAHEFGHQLGLPDLYDIYTNRPVVGVFDNMDSGGLLGAIVLGEDGREHYVEGFIPGGLGAWSRYLLGWTRADTVRTFENSLALPAVGKCPARLVRVEAAADEYYLLENRAAELDNIYTGFVVDPQTGVILGPANCLNCDGGFPEEFEWEFTNGYDLLLPTESPTPGPDGGPGLLVWQVDEYFIARRWDENEVNSRWPFGVRLVEANGVVDLGDPSSRFGLGWFDDAFYAGNATEMSDSTLPPAWSNWRVPTGVRLEGVSGRDTLMSCGAGVREMRATRMIEGGWRPARHGVLHLPGEFRVLVIDESGNARIAGRNEPVFSISAEEDEEDPPLTPAAYAAAFDQATGEGAVILARRSGAVYAFRDGDWQTCTGFWPVRVGELASHPLPLAAAAGPLVAAASREGALFVLRSNGVQVPGSPLLLAEDYIFTGNLVARLDESGAATGMFALSNRRFDPAGVWLTSYSVVTGELEPDTDFAAFVTAGGDELDGPIYLVGGAILPQRGGSQAWIVFGASGRAVLCGAGEIISERRFGAAIDEPPAVADINGDGRLDLVCSDGERIFVIDPSGANITGWPRSVNNVFALPTGVRVSGSPIAASVAGRSYVAAATDAGILFVFDGQGALVPGWPRKTTGVSYHTVDFVARDDEGLIAYIDQVFNANDDDFFALRPEGGRARWRAAPFASFDALRAWSGVFGGPGRAAFATGSQGGGEAPRAWTELASNLVVYPNPSDGRRVAFHFSAPETGSARLQILTLAGETVLERSMRMLGGETEFAVSMSGSAPGIYLCRVVVTSGGRTVEARRKFAIVN